MTTVEFRPKLFVPVNIAVFLLSLVVPIYALSVLISQCNALNIYPEATRTVHLLYIVIFISCIFPFTSLALILHSVLNKKITIEGEVLYIFDKEWFRSPTKKILHLKEVKKITLKNWDSATVKKIELHIKKINPKIIIDTKD